MSKTKYLLKHIEMFLLSLIILLTTLIVVLRLTVLNKSFVKRQFSEAHYQKVENNLKEEMKASMMSSGINTSVIDTMFTTSDIRDTTNQVIDIIYNYHHQKLDTSKIQTKLEANVQEDLQKHNYQLEDQTGYQEFINSTMKIYQNEFTMLNKVETVGQIATSAIKITTVLSIFLTMSLFLLILLKSKTMKELLPVPLLTTSFLILFGSYYINKTAGLSSITIFSVTFSDILRSMIDKTFLCYKVIAIVYIVIAVFINLFLVKKHHRRHRHHHSK